MFFLHFFPTLHLYFTLSFLILPPIMAHSTTIPPFTLSSPPGTDIWRKPPSHNAFNASIFPTSPSTYPLSSFNRAQITFALPPASRLRQYDQAGLLLHLTKPGLSDMQTKWVKTGIEFYNGKPYVATVGCDTWADWSLVPMPDFPPTTADSPAHQRPGATIEARREQDALGKSLWIYWLVRDERGNEVERRPLRELTWIFAQEDGWDLAVSGYVCRPTKEGGEEELQAEFGEGLQVETSELRNH